MKHSSHLKEALYQAIASPPLINWEIVLIHKGSIGRRSNHNLLKFLFKLERVIKYHCEGDLCLDKFILSKDEWTLVGSLFKFLAPLATFIKDMNASKYPNFPSVMLDY